jgi:hypothetical protein
VLYSPRSMDTQVDTWVRVPVSCRFETRRSSSPVDSGRFTLPVDANLFEGNRPMGTLLQFRSGNELLDELCLRVARATEEPPSRTCDRRRFVRYVIRRYGRLERYDQDQRALAVLERSLEYFVETRAGRVST